MASVEEEDAFDFLADGGEELVERTSALES